MAKRGTDAAHDPAPLDREWVAQQICELRAEFTRRLDNLLDEVFPKQPYQFIPNPFQRAVLDALDGKAMRTDALAAKVGDRRRLFKDPGGLPELQEEGLVEWHKRLGFYRPDAPPPDVDGTN